MLPARSLGSKTARFRDWKVGDSLVFLVNKAVAGVAEVSGEPYVSKQRVWDNGVFPHRILVKFVHVLLPRSRPPVLGDIRDALTSAWGTRYGIGILNQSILPDAGAQVVLEAIRSCRNDLGEVRANLDSLLDEAKNQREAAQKQVRKRGRPRRQEPGPEARVEVEPLGSREEESAHSRAQSALIRLGKLTGCSVWIASNDRNRQYRGRSLGEGCLKSLPSLGLSEEATDRISRIDIIWIRQNAPVCAFEVETTTAVYSGLLRMADLLALVPALNVKLFVVGPSEREGKVMDELARPTFQKIGLSEFCRFISAEELDSLLARAQGFEGHVQPSVVDTIAIESEGQLQSTLH